MRSELSSNERGLAVAVARHFAPQGLKGIILPNNLREYKLQEEFEVLTGCKLGQKEEDDNRRAWIEPLRDAFFIKLGHCNVARRAYNLLCEGNAEIDVNLALSDISLRFYLLANSLKLPSIHLVQIEQSQRGGYAHIDFVPNFKSPFLSSAIGGLYKLATQAGLPVSQLSLLPARELVDQVNHPAA